MSDEAYRDIQVSTHEAHPAIRFLTLARVARRNAMSPSLVAEAQHFLEKSRSDSSIGAIILHGAGAGFCAGSDLAALAAMTNDQRFAFEADSGRLARTIMAHPKPVIAAVHGFAIGGGLTLAAACDIVVTSPDAKWSLPEVPIGLFPAWGLESVVARTGQAVARQLSWGIETLDGTQAAATGLADRLAADPLAAAVDLAGRLAELPMAQAAAVKSYFSREHCGDAADEAANLLFMAACSSPQAQASFSRFGRSAIIADPPE